MLQSSVPWAKSLSGLPEVPQDKRLSGQKGGLPSLFAVTVFTQRGCFRLRLLLMPVGMVHHTTGANCRAPSLRELLEKDQTSNKRASVTEKHSASLSKGATL